MVYLLWLYLESKYSILAFAVALMSEKQTNVFLKFLIIYSGWKWDQYSFPNNSKHNELAPQFISNTKKCEAPAYTKEHIRSWHQSQGLGFWTSADHHDNQLIPSNQMTKQVQQYILS